MKFCKNINSFDFRGWRISYRGEKVFVCTSQQMIVYVAIDFEGFKLSGTFILGKRFFSTTDQRERERERERETTAKERKLNIFVFIVFYF